MRLNTSSFNASVSPINVQSQWLHLAESLPLLLHSYINSPAGQARLAEYNLHVLAVLIQEHA